MPCLLPQLAWQGGGQALQVADLVLITDVAHRCPHIVSLGLHAGPTGQSRCIVRSSCAPGAAATVRALAPALALTSSW